MRVGSTVFFFVLLAVDIAAAVHVTDRGYYDEDDADHLHADPEYRNPPAPLASEAYRTTSDETNSYNAHKVDNIKTEMEKIAPGSSKSLNDMITKMNTKMEKLAPALKSELAPGSAEAEPAAEEHSSSERSSAKAMSDTTAALDDNVASLRTQMASRSEHNEGADSAADETMAVAASTNKMIELEAAKEQKEEVELASEIKRQDDIVSIATAARKISQAKLKSLEAAGNALKSQKTDDPKPKSNGLVEEEDYEDNNDEYQTNRNELPSSREEHSSSRQEHRPKQDSKEQSADIGELQDLLSQITQVMGGAV